MTRVPAAVEVPAVVLLAALFVRASGALGTFGAAAGAAVWIYLPLLLLRARDLPPSAFGFGRSAWIGGWKLGLLVCLLVLPPVAAVLTLARGMPAWPPLSTLAAAAGWQLAIIVVPEEIFFRGYVQTRLKSASPLAAILLTALLFAAAHVLAAPGWMRAAVFFPGLVMGWLRHRTAGLTAGALFHWAANLLWMGWQL
jgi:membrane protease YdiL (CAAX protease family)